MTDIDPTPAAATDPSRTATDPSRTATDPSRTATDPSRTATDPMLVDTLVRFAAELRGAGLKVGSGDVVTYCAATATLDPTDLLDLYWAGRTTLVSRPDQIPVYHDVFLSFFLGEDLARDEPFQPTPRARAEARAALEVPETEDSPESRSDEVTRLGLAASDARVLRHKAFRECTPEELAAMRRITRRIRLTPPRRRTRRTVSGKGPRHDVRRTVRETMRTHGEPAELFWRCRQLRPRPLTLILDVSGSMADHSRALLQFAHTATRARSRVEVFCFGTRLTRITRELQYRRVSDALDAAATAVVDWDGGTRIGDSLQTYVQDWGRRGTSRGGLVVVCSDGLDRGDPAVLDAAMERLGRQCHRIIWLLPQTAGAEGAPPMVSIGMQVVRPHVDAFVPAGDLAGLEAFAALVAELE